MNTTTFTADGHQFTIGETFVPRPDYESHCSWSIIEVLTPLSTNGEKVRCLTYPYGGGTPQVVYIYGHTLKSGSTKYMPKPTTHIKRFEVTIESPTDIYWNSSNVRIQLDTGTYASSMEKSAVTVRELS